MDRKKSPAFKPIKYPDFIEGEKELLNGEKPLMKDRVSVGMIVLFLSTIDAFTLFTVIDQLLTEIWIINIVLTLGGAVILNILPVVLGEFLARKKYSMGKNNVVYISILIGTFLIFYTATCILRWNTSLIEGDNASGMQNATMALTIFLMIIPLITGVIATFLSFSLNDPVKNKIKRYSIYQIRLEAHLNDLKAAERDLVIDQETLIHTESVYYIAAKDGVSALFEGFKRHVRFMLAKYLKDPKAVTYLNQEEIV